MGVKKVSSSQKVNFKVTQGHWHQYLQQAHDFILVLLCNYPNGHGYV